MGYSKLAHNLPALSAFFLGSLATLFACSTKPPPPSTALITECAPKIIDSCPDNDALCLREAAIELQSGAIRKRDYSKSAECLECSCNSDDSEACRRLGVLYMQGQGVAKDGDRALTLFQNACDDGDGDACAWIGLFLVDSGNKSPKSAMVDIRKGCTMGGAMACARLGSAYARGKYVARKDISRAKQLLISSCEQGDPYGCRMMGALTRKGLKDEARAIHWYDKACSLQDHLGCWELGLSYTQRAVAERNLKKGAQSFDKACLYGSEDACNSLGEMKREGQGVSVNQDLKAATTLFKEACDGKSIPGCFNWGSALATGSGIEQDLKAAMAPMELACQGKEKNACAWLASQYLSSKELKRDLDKALTLFDSACALNHWQACLNLLHLAANGVAWKGDPEEAPRRMLSACEAGDFDACYQLGLLYRQQSAKSEKATEETSQAEESARLSASEKKSLPLFEKACAGKIDAACLEAAVILANPADGLSHDYERAAQLFQPLCENRNARACNELGFLHANGKGVPKDRAKAFSLFKIACDQDLALACRRVAKGYEKGWGSTVDRDLAQKHYDKACTLGCADCCAPVSSKESKDKTKSP